MVEKERYWRLSFFSSCGLALALAFLGGCTAAQTITQTALDVPRYIAERIEQKGQLCEERRLDHEAVHQARLEDLREERERLRLSREALLAEQQLLRELCKREHEADLACQDAEARMKLKAREPRYQEKLKSQLELTVGQAIQVGQLQVDAEKLKKLMGDRDKEHQLLLSAWKELEDQRRADLRREKLKEASEALQDGDECAARAALRSCAAPLIEKLKDRAALREPLKQPILPTEIPLMLPVNLVVEMDNPTIEKSEIQRIPLRQPEALRECQPEDGRESLKDGDCCPSQTPCESCTERCSPWSGLPPAPACSDE